MQNFIMDQNDYPKGLQKIVGIGAIISSCLIAFMIYDVKSKDYIKQIDSAILSSDIDGNKILDESEKKLVYDRLEEKGYLREKGFPFFPALMDERTIREYVEAHSTFK